MAAPISRVPVRIARGLKADLIAGLSSIYEGEICFATDESILYIKIGSNLEVAGSGNLSGLIDTNLTSTPPVSGDLLKYDGTNWVPFKGVTGSFSGTSQIVTVTNGLITAIV